MKKRPVLGDKEARRGGGIVMNVGGQGRHEKLAYHISQALGN